MPTLIKILSLIGAMLFGYIVASFPSGVIVGKVFYKQDIRLLGSKNTGATNAGRVFGKKAFWLVMMADIIKVVSPIWIVTYTIAGFGWEPYTWMPWVSYLTALGGTLGHCFPIFADFKGGKAVSSFGAFAVTTNWILTLAGILFLMLTLKIKKYVSLASIVGSGTVVILSLLLLIPGWDRIGMYPLMESGLIYTGFLFIQALFLYWRHHENIVRLLSHKERKITWMK